MPGTVAGRGGLRRRSEGRRSRLGPIGGKPQGFRGGFTHFCTPKIRGACLRRNPYNRLSHVPKWDPNGPKWPDFGPNQGPRAPHFRGGAPGPPMGPSLFSFQLRAPRSPAAALLASALVASRRPPPPLSLHRRRCRRALRRRPPSSSLQPPAAVASPTRSRPRCTLHAESNSNSPAAT